MEINFLLHSVRKERRAAGEEVSDTQEVRIQKSLSFDQFITSSSILLMTFHVKIVNKYH